MDTEKYLNHPNFGLLFKVCQMEEKQELFTTIYAQRLFFLVKVGTPSAAPSESERLTLEPISRSDARLMVEARLGRLRCTRLSEDYQALSAIYQRIFQ